MKIHDIKVHNVENLLFHVSDLTTVNKPNHSAVLYYESISIEAF